MNISDKISIFSICAFHANHSNSLILQQKNEESTSQFSHEIIQIRVLKTMLGNDWYKSCPTFESFKYAEYLLKFSI